MTGRRFLFMVMLLLPLILALPLAAQEDGPAQMGLRPDAPEYALHGPYWVGTMEFTIRSESGRSLPLTVWYPAVKSAADDETVTYYYDVVGSAIEDASPDAANGPYPLVIYAHGGFGMRYGAAFLTEHLTSWGFVVIAVNYDDSLDTNGRAHPLHLTVYTRPRNVTRQIDFATTLDGEAQVLVGMIDTERIAITGQSWGGYTAYAASGARIDGEWFSRLEEEHPEACIAPEEMGGENWCARTFLDHQQQIADVAGLEEVPEKLWPSWGDSRIDAMIGMAPDGYAFGPDGLRDVDIPVMLMTGSVDTFNPPKYSVYQPYTFLESEEKAQVVFDGANHMIFGNACKALSWVIDMGQNWNCSDSVWDMDRAHDLINHFTTAFLLDVLKGDEAAHAALAPENVTFPGITYEAEGF